MDDIEITEGQMIEGWWDEPTIEFVPSAELLALAKQQEG